MPLPETLFRTVIAAAGATLAERVAADAARSGACPIHPVDAALALRAEVRAAVQAADLRKAVVDAVAQQGDLTALLREAVAGHVEKVVDAERAVDELCEEIERDLRREVENLDLEDMARDLLSDEIDEMAKRSCLSEAAEAVVAVFMDEDDGRTAVVDAAGRHLVDLLIAQTTAESGAAPA